MSETTTELPSTATLITLGATLYLHQQEMGGCRPEDIKPFAEIADEQREIWMSLAGLAWQRSQPPGLAILRREAQRDRGILDRLYEVLDDSGVAVNIAPKEHLPEGIACLLKELADRRAAPPVGALVAGPFPAQLVEAVAGFIERGGRITVERNLGAKTVEDLRSGLISLQSQLDRTERVTSAVTGRLEVDGRQAIAQIEALRDQIAEAEDGLVCGHNCSGYGCVVARKDWKREGFSCGTAGCPGLAQRESG